MKRGVKQPFARGPQSWPLIRCGEKRRQAAALQSAAAIDLTTHDARAGLTLIEVLLAIAILGAAAGVLMAAASRCLSVVKVAHNYYEARRILEISEIEHPLLVIKEEGEDKAINLNVSPVEYPKGFTFTRVSERSGVHKDLMIVRDRVSWSARGKSSFEEVTTYLYYTNEVSL